MTMAWADQSPELDQASILFGLGAFLVLLGFLVFPGFLVFFGSLASLFLVFLVFLGFLASLLARFLGFIGFLASLSSWFSLTVKGNGWLWIACGQEDPLSIWLGHVLHHAAKKKHVAS
jgi:hypothetical protein